MKLTIDRDADALYLNLDESADAESEERYLEESFSITVRRGKLSG
jgi:uncharacterized protein YuzE